MRTIHSKINKSSNLPLTKKNINTHQDKRKNLKNIDAKQELGQRLLVNKSSLKREKETHLESDFKEERQKLNKRSRHSTRIQKDDQTEIEINDATTLFLSKNNLRLLQKEIGELETRTEICKHFLCSNENMANVEFSRLWFLFELEMSVNGDINLRNDCYYNKIYKNMDNVWPKSNCLKDKLPSKLVPMQLSQIILPKPLNIKFHGNNYNESLSNMSVLVESIVENTSPIRNKKRQMIPTNKLAKRDKKEVFENIKIDVKTILQDKTSSTIVLESSILEDKPPNSDKTRIKLGKLSYFRS